MNRPLLVPAYPAAALLLGGRGAFARGRTPPRAFFFRVPAAAHVPMLGQGAGGCVEPAQCGGGAVHAATVAQAVAGAYPADRYSFGVLAANTARGRGQ